MMSSLRFKSHIENLSDETENYNKKRTTCMHTLTGLFFFFFFGTNMRVFTSKELTLTWEMQRSVYCFHCHLNDGRSSSILLELAPFARFELPHLLLPHPSPSHQPPT